jgi:hypothetical protein
MNILDMKRKMLPLGNPQGDDGGGGQATSTTQTQDLPPWAIPYAQEVLGKGSALASAPYQAYKGERIAQFTPLQQRAFQGATNMQPSAATGQGIDVAGQAAQRALGTSYDAGQFQNQFQAPSQYDPSQFRAQQVRTQSFAQPGSAEAYMSPYMQSVVGMQQREATRASDIQRNQNQAQAVGQGAFGGSRQAIVEAERQRNLGTQLGDIQATGLQSAYQQAQQQFNAEQQARLQAQQANQSAGMNAQQMAEQSRQFGAGQGMTAAQQAAQYGQAAQQLEEQSRQYGAGLGLQGLQTALTGAGQLGALGQQQFTQGMDVNKLQAGYGTQQQQQVQNVLGQQYQDFLDQKRAPYQQLEFQSNLLRGTPSGTTQSLYTAAPSTSSQLAGLGTAALGVSKFMAKGGKVSDAKVKREKKKSAGLAELALSKI